MIYICHHTDNDGYAGAGILYWYLLCFHEDGCFNPESETHLNEPTSIELIPCNYGFSFDKFLDKLAKGDIVYIVDFSFEPDVFKQIVDKTNNCDWLGDTEVDNIVWIDHHDSAIKKYENIGWELDDLIDGLRSTKASGCELAWIWSYCPEDILYAQDEDICDIFTIDGVPHNTPDERIEVIRYDNDGDIFRIPKCIRLVGDWDTWTFKYGEEAKLFNAGLKMYDSRPPYFWRDLIDNEINEGIGDTIDEILEIGKLVMRYEENMYARMCKHGKFEFIDTLGRKWIALNTAIHTSKVFGEDAGARKIPTGNRA